MRSIGVKSIGTFPDEDCDKIVCSMGGVAARSASALNDTRGFLLAVESVLDSIPAARSDDDEGRVESESDGEAREETAKLGIEKMRRRKNDGNARTEKEP